MMIVTLFLSMQTTFSFLEKIIAYLLQGHNSKVIIFIKKEKKIKKQKTEKATFIPLQSVFKIHHFKKLKSQSFNQNVQILFSGRLCFFIFCCYCSK